MTTTPIAPAAVPVTARRWGAWRTVIVIFAGLLVLFGGGALIGGAAALAIHEDHGNDGYYTAGPERFSTDTSALSIPSLDIDLAGPDAFSAEDLLGRVRLKLESTNPSTPLFIGIGPSDEVAKYLSGMAHDELTDVDASPFKATYTSKPGGSPTSNPADQSFWVASDTGTGARTLNWDVADGNWSILIMHADGSAGVDADISAAAQLPVIRPVAIVTLAIGGVMMLVGIAVIMLTVTTRPKTRNQSVMS